MEVVKVQPMANEPRRRRSFLLMAECRGVGATPNRRKELANMRKAIVLEWPWSMSEKTAILIGLDQISQRDFPPGDDGEFRSYVERWVMVP